MCDCLSKQRGSFDMCTVQIFIVLMTLSEMIAGIDTTSPQDVVRLLGHSVRILQIAVCKLITKIAFAVSILTDCEWRLS